MNGDLALASPKPLPSPGRDEKLPPLPPPEDYDCPPPPPQKIVQNPDPNDASLSAIGPPSPQTSMDSKPKKANPLSDLIDSEKVYVEQLTGIIRKVASAWSRSNLPPPELDTMFRSVESIHKANRQLLAKLKEIGTNPSSPKALGDLLMRWIEDLDVPYTTYSTKFCCGFDAWEPVQSNDRLRTVLAMFSSSHPPPLPVTAPAHPAEPPIWTLDELFLLPKARIKYYRKLYTRLLKSTTPGRSDHRLLSGALEKLDKLIATLDERASVKVSSGSPPALVQSPVQTPIETEDEVVIDMRSRASAMPLASSISPFASSEQRASDGTHGSSSESSGRWSEDTPPTSADNRSSSSTMTSPITDLERRLSTERTLDIFTMQPKQVRLQMCPPTLHYTREVRFSLDVVISVTPRATGIEVVQERGHVYLLTDLMLICERKTPSEKAQSQDDSDMWLLYPPLAGKHLRVAPLPDSDTALSVTIMRKETLILYTHNPSLRDQLLAEFRDCIETATQLFPSSKTAPPPVPPLPQMNGMQQEPRGPSQHPHTLQEQRPERSMSPPSRSLSPNGRVPTHMDSSVINGLERLALQQDQMPHSPHGQAYPPRSASMGESGPSRLNRQPSFGLGQVVPPQHQQYHPAPSSQGPPSFAPGQILPGPSFAPGQVMPQQQPPPLGMNGGGPMHPGALSRGPSAGGRVGPPGPQMQLPERNHSMPGPYGPAPGQGMPPRDPNFRSHPPDAGFHPGRGGHPGPGRGGPPGGLPGHPSPFGPPQHGPLQHGHPLHGPPQPQSRPPSDGSYHSGLRKSSSSRSLRSHQEHNPPMSAPPMPDYPGDLAPPRPNFVPRTNSTSSLYSLPSSLYREPQPHPKTPGQMSVRSISTGFSIQDTSPPSSPVEEAPPQLGPTSSTISAQMKCKIFLQQQHAQWKSLGAAKLKLYRESPTNIKQLVVEADDRKKSVLISTIVLVDGVERVGKTGVAVELSDKGQRTGVIYMIQCRNEQSAQGLFDSLLAGSDRYVAAQRG